MYAWWGREGMRPMGMLGGGNSPPVYVLAVTPPYSTKWIRCRRDDITQVNVSRFHPNLLIWDQI